MAYIKTNWEDLPSYNTPISSTNLNKIENGIESVTTASEAHASASLSVHGISNTANLVYTSDTRLTDARQPRLLDSQTFSSSQTYTYPSGAKFVVVEVFGAGGGGGSGGKQAAATNYAWGGGGGASGDAYRAVIPVEGTTATVVVGAGGSGGAAITGTAPLSGATGSVGGFSRFATVSALGGFAGTGGGTAAGAGGIGGFAPLGPPRSIGWGVGGASSSGVTPNALTPYAGGGGGGGYFDTAQGNAQTSGAGTADPASAVTMSGNQTFSFTFSGGVAGGAVNTNGTAGNNPGVGGSGGGLGSTAAGGNGGNGAAAGVLSNVPYAGAGGGGGGGGRGFNSGAGGTGGAGMVRIWVYG